MLLTDGEMNQDCHQPERFETRAWWSEVNYTLPLGQGGSRYTESLK